VESSKVCPDCAGTVEIEVISEPKSESRICFASFVVGTCRQCGRTFTEAELEQLEKSILDP
jgi:hypothetical protein